MFKILIFSVLAVVVSCGPFPYSERSGRIIGGKNAVLGQFPYQVSLFYVGRNHHDCGGSIISENWVLSAAHCTIDRLPSDYRILAGSILIFGDPNQIQRDISKIINHPQYSTTLLHNDICVIRVSQPFVYTSNVQPIKLGTQFIGGGMSAVVSGWGIVGYGGPLATTLQFLNTKTISNEECIRRTGSVYHVIPSKLCDSNPVGQGICSSDSGGPLAAGGVQIGVVSWSIKCASGFPAAYARVSSFISWINANAVG